MKFIRFWQFKYSDAYGDSLEVVLKICAYEDDIKRLYEQIKTNNPFFCVDVDIYNLSFFAMVDWIEE